MNTKTDNLKPRAVSLFDEEEAARRPERAAEKKEFVEPEVTSPVDVLEATTFFQLTDSGTTT